MKNSVQNGCNWIAAEDKGGTAGWIKPVWFTVKPEKQNSIQFLKGITKKGTVFQSLDKIIVPSVNGAGNNN